VVPSLLFGERLDDARKSKYGTWQANVSRRRDQVNVIEKAWMAA
jgi:hypothetical protein